MVNIWNIFCGIVAALLTTHPATGRGLFSAFNASRCLPGGLDNNKKRHLDKRPAAVILAVFFNMTIAGCGSSPSAKFYILNTIDQNTATSAPTSEERNIVVKVGPITIPDTLDHLQIVTLSGENQLNLNEFNRWGGDFQDGIQRVLVENISLLLPTDQVYLYQETTLLPVDFPVMVNVREFYGKLGGRVSLNADWTVIYRGREKVVIAKKSVLRENTGRADYSAYVAAQSRLLARLSQEIAAAIRATLRQ